MGGNFTQSRRGFLQGAAAVTITASVGGVTTYTLVRNRDSRPSDRTLTADELEYELFAPVSGDELKIGRSSGVVTSVTEQASYSNADGVSGTSFSIIIKSPDVLDQGIYDFRHTGIGRFPMFIVPVDLPTGGAYTYEAVFNRLS